MSDRIRKALSDGGKLTVTLEYRLNGNLEYSIHESAFRLDAYKKGAVVKAELDAAKDPDALILRAVSQAVRDNHISWEAQQ